MVYIFRNQSSTGARDLAQAVHGERVRNFENGRLFKRRRSGRLLPVPTLTPADGVVMWGAHLRGLTLRAKILNNAPLRNKFEDAQTLTRAGVATIEAVRQIPPARPAVAPPDPALPIWAHAQELAEAFSGLTCARSRPTLDGLDELTRALGELSTSLRRPAPIPPFVPPTGQLIWLSRTNDHVGGTDLLTPPARPDFYVRKLALVEEFRVHSFLGKSIRAGKKVPREGFVAGRSLHPWVRSHEGGWRILYDGVNLKKRNNIRDLAHAAVRALGLQFGAVDIGVLADGTPIVLEVNRAPGLEGGTITAYANALQNWVTGAWAV